MGTRHVRDRRSAEREHAGEETCKVLECVRGIEISICVDDGVGDVEEIT